MTKCEREKLKKTAYHEAGHAVAAFAMSKRFKRVSTIPNPDKDSLGRLSGCG
jgi:ATP-dependent Zn protease